MFQIYHRNQEPIVFQAETTDLAKKYYVLNILCTFRNFFSQTVYFLFAGGLKPYCLPQYSNQIAPCLSMKEESWLYCHMIICDISSSQRLSPFSRFLYFRFYHFQRFCVLSFK